MGVKTFTKRQVEKLEESYIVTFYKLQSFIEQDELINLIKDYEYLAITRRSIKDFDSILIDNLPKLKGLSIYCTGYEWVDIEKLRERNILVNNLPHYAKTSVAEHTIGLILTLSRRIHLSAEKIKGSIPDNVSLRGWEFKHKKLGIIGLGRIGKEVAKFASNFDVEVCYYDLKKNSSKYATYQNLEELLKSSDIIAILASSQRNAPPIISTSEIALMKKGVYLINTARAKLVDNNAIKKAISHKHINGYAVDDKFISKNNDIIDFGRIVETNHTAWYSTETIRRGTKSWVDNFLSLIADKPRNLI